MWHRGVRRARSQPSTSWSTGCAGWSTGVTTPPVWRLDDGKISLAKKAGKLANLEKALAEEPLPASGVGIGHTRWATHGGPTDRNAHPHAFRRTAGSP